MVVDLSVRVSVLIPEQTFQPTMHDARVLDISERGALVALSLQADTYRAMLQQPRYCRIQFIDRTDLPDKVMGKAVWIQPETFHGTTTYKIGLFFENIADDDLAKLRTFVEGLRILPGDVRK